MGKRASETDLRGMRALGHALLVATLACAGSLGAQVHPVVAIPKLDENRLQGVWYEIAAYPSKPEKRCVSDSVELIALGDRPHQLQLVDSCKEKGNYTAARNNVANAKNKNGGGEFTVGYIPLLKKKYWILALGSDYEWAMIGSPNHKALWVFSRKPTLSPDVLRTIEAQGEAEGFPASRLRRTKQTQTPLPAPSKTTPQQESGQAPQ